MPAIAEFSARGGKAKAGEMALTKAANVPLKLRVSEAFRPYVGPMKAYRKAVVNDMARTVGGGRCGPVPAGMAAVASLQLAAARFLLEKAMACAGEERELRDRNGNVTGYIDASLELFRRGSTLADSSRQNLLAAHELCAKEAVARKKMEAVDPTLQLAAAIGGTVTSQPQNDDGDT